MAEERISSYIDLAAIEGETTAMIKEIQRLTTEFDKLKASKLSIQGSSSTPELVNNIRNSTKETQNLVEAQTRLNIVNKEAAAQVAVNTTAVKAHVAAITQENKSLEDNVTQRRKLQNSMQSYIIDQKQDAELLKNGVINRNEYNKRLTEGTIKIEQYKNKIAELNKTINTQTQTETQKSIAVSAAATKEAKVQADLANSYKQLSTQYNEAALKAKILATQLGVGNPVAIQAASNAKKLGEELKQIDASVGQNQRNVGNYAGSLGGFFTQLYSKVRVLANILPGIGISGIFLAAYEGVKLLIGAMNELTADQKVLSDVFKKSADGAGEQVATLSVYKTKLNDLSLSEKDRLIVAKEYNKVADDANQLDLTQINNLDLINGKIAKQIGLIERQALAQAARAKLGEAASVLINAQESLQAGLSGTGLSEQDIEKGVDAQSKLSVAILKTQQTTLDAGKKIQAQPGIGEKVESDNDKLSKLALSVPKKVRELYASVTKAKLDFEHQSSLLNPLISVDGLTTDDKTGKGSKGTVELQSTKENIDAEFELYKIAQERKIKLLDDDVKNEALGFDKRLDALNAFSTAKLDLIDRQAAHEIQKENEKEKVLKANLSKQKGTQRNNSLVEIENIEKQKGIIQAKAASDRLSVFDANEKEFNVIAKQRGDDYLKQEKAKYDKALALIEESKNNEKAASDKEYNGALDALQYKLDAGLITQREFNNKKLDLDFAYAVASLAIEEDRIRKIIALKALTGQDVSKELFALEELERKIRNASVDHTKTTEKEKQAYILKTLNTIKEVGDQVFGLISGIGNAQLTAQKNAITEQQNAAEKKAARDIEIVNASVLSEQDKAAKITIINARLQAQKDQFAQREKQAQQQKARTDKAAAIFDIILNTAINVAKHIGNPFLAAAVAALGAAQLAIAVATPIPKFKTGKGKGNNYEGLAIVGDGGKKEVIEGADGSFRVTPATDTLTHVKSTDIIHPDFNAWRDAMLNAAYRDASRGMRMPQTQAKDDGLARQMKEQTMLLKQIADKPTQIIHGTEQGMTQLWRRKAHDVSYLDQNTNW